MGNRLYNLEYLENYLIEIIFEFYLSSNNCKELDIKWFENIFLRQTL